MRHSREDARNDAGHEQRGDRHAAARRQRVDDHVVRRRNQDADDRRRDRHVDRVVGVVALLLHQRDQDRAQRRRVGDGRAGDAAEQRAGEHVDEPEAAADVAASRTRVTVPVSGSWRARAVIRGPSVSGQAGSGARPPAPGAGVRAGEQGVGAVDLVAGGAEVPARPGRGRCRGRCSIPSAGRPAAWSGVGGPGAGVEAQLGLQRLADGAGADEADQAAGRRPATAAGRPGRWPAAGR